MPVRVAVDAMGGDHAPEVVIRGVLRVLRKNRPASCSAGR